MTARSRHASTPQSRRQLPLRIPLRQGGPVLRPRGRPSTLLQARPSEEESDLKRRPVHALGGTPGAVSRPQSVSQSRSGAARILSGDTAPSS